VVDGKATPRFAKVADYIIEIPAAPDLLAPILEVVAAATAGLSYIAVRRGCDVDQPRNLAKSVTVE